MTKNQFFIDAEDRQELIEFYQLKLDKIDSERSRIIDKIHSLGGDCDRKEYKTILSDINEDNEPSLGNYNKSWKWEEKISFALNTLGVISQKSSIVDVLIKLEPELDNENSRNSIGASLSRLSKDGSDYQVFGKIDIKGIRAYYGLLDWFDKDSNKVLEKYSGSFPDNNFIEVSSFDLF